MTSYETVDWYVPEDKKKKKQNHFSLVKGSIKLWPNRSEKQLTTYETITEWVQNWQEVDVMFQHLNVPQHGDFSTM